MSSYDANNDPIWNDAPVAKNGVKFRRYDDFSEGHPVRQIRPEDNASIIIGEYRYVYREHEGDALVFRNPIKSSNNINVNVNTKPSNDAHTQSQTQLDGRQIIDKLSEIAAKLSEITSIVRRMEMHMLGSKSGTGTTTTTDNTTPKAS
jgi:hypothetical protein